MKNSILIEKATLQKTKNRRTSPRANREKPYIKNGPTSYTPDQNLKREKKTTTETTILNGGNNTNQQKKRRNNRHAINPLDPKTGVISMTPGNRTLRIITINPTT